MHIAGMRERNTAGGGALDAIAAFRPRSHPVDFVQFPTEKEKTQLATDETVFYKFNIFQHVFVCI